jgi:hypothetical protein
MEPEQFTMPKIDDVKAGLKRLLPILETISRLTPTPIDDAAVIFLKQLLASDERLLAAMSI